MFRFICRRLGITTKGKILNESEKFDNKHKIAYLESKLIHINKLRKRYKNHIILNQKDLEELYEFKSDLDIRLGEFSKDLKIIEKNLDELKTLEEVKIEEVIQVLNTIKRFIELEIKESLKYI